MALTFEEEEKNKQEQKPEQFKLFVRDPEVRAFIKRWKERGLTERGIVEMLLLAYPRYNDKKSILKRVTSALKALIGIDGFQAELNALKPSSEKKEKPKE